MCLCPLVAIPICWLPTRGSIFCDKPCTKVYKMIQILSNHKKKTPECVFFKHGDNNTYGGYAMNARGCCITNRSGSYITRTRGGYITNRRGACIMKTCGRSTKNTCVEVTSRIRMYALLRGRQVIHPVPANLQQNERDDQNDHRRLIGRSFS